MITQKGMAVGLPAPINVVDQDVGNPISALLLFSISKFIVINWFQN